MDFPIEYHDRMIAEQMVMMEAFQFIWQILICFALLMTFVALIVNLSGIVRTRLSEMKHLQETIATAMGDQAH